MTIDSQDKYDAAVKLLELLNNLSLGHVTSKLKDSIETEEEYWTQCENCNECLAECYCEYDDAPYYEDYDDDDEKDSPTVEKKSV